MPCASVSVKFFSVLNTWLFWHCNPEGPNRPTERFGCTHQCVLFLSQFFSINNNEVPPPSLWIQESIHLHVNGLVSPAFAASLVPPLKSRTSRNLLSADAVFRFIGLTAAVWTSCSDFPVYYLLASSPLKQALKHPSEQRAKW